jgi:thiamine pyrophosphokinase
LSPDALIGLPADAYIIAADSGLDHALAAGLRPHLVVGDFDSVKPETLAWAAAEGIEIEQHSPDKDNTDTELALAAARTSRATDVVLLGGGGDRLDHSIAAITALGHQSMAAFTTVSARWDTTMISVLHAPRAITFATELDATFSLLALHGACSGIDVDGGLWPLSDAELQPGSSLGVSNRTTANELQIRVRTGVLTVVFPLHFGGQI